MSEKDKEMEDVLVQYKEGIRKRLMEQISRQIKFSPHIGMRTVIDMQINQEVEKLRKLQDKAEDEEQYNVADAFGSLADQWVHEVKEEFYRRYG